MFVSKNHTFLTAQLKHDFPANRITLRARKALRVMCLRTITLGWGEAPFQVLSPRQGRKFSEILKERTLFRKFHENLKCSGAWKNLSSAKYFATAHRQTQRSHSWIARDLIYLKKLVLCKTNSQILRNHHFRLQKSHFFDNPIEARFPSKPYYS